MKKRFGVTNRGIIWELANSIWIAATFVMMFGWAAFLYIGIRTKQRKWVAWGVFYLAIIIGCVMLNGMGGVPENVASAAIMIYMASWLMCIIHAFLARKEFLIRLEALRDSSKQRKKNDMLRQRIRQEYVGENESDEISVTASVREATEKVQQAMEEQKRREASIQAGQSLAGQTDSAPATGSDVNTTFASGRSGRGEPEMSDPEKNARDEPRMTGPEGQLRMEAPEKIWDVNCCTAEELAELPGITIIMAKKAVAHRQESGEFSSVEDFLEFIALKPHFVVQIRDRLACTLKSAPSDCKSEKTGRILDF